MWLVLLLARTCSRHDIPPTKRIVAVKGFMNVEVKIDGRRNDEYGKFKLVV